MDLNPAVTLQDEPQWLNPVLLGTETLRQRALAPASLAAVRDVLDRLVGDPFIDFMRRYYALGHERFGAEWGFLDQLTVLHAAASLVRPRRYLEIGVFRGRSLAVVAGAAPEADLHGFDLWVAGYAGLDNTGPDLVREQLRRVGHRGRVELVGGSSHETVPAFLDAHPGLCFDLVTVDGDHTEAGARRDLETVLPRVAVGGVLVFDDLRHPKCPWLERVWDEVVGGHPAFAADKFTGIGWGVGFAVRRAEARPEVEALTGNGGERLRRLAELLDEERAARDERLEACEADRALRLEVIGRQGDELGQVTAERDEARAERDDLRARLEAGEADRARRLEVIQRQGDELGHVTAERNEARAEREALRARLEASEADRAQRLEIIQRQGDELGHVTAERNEARAEREALRAEREALRAERDDLRVRLEASEADRARRLEVIQRQGDELGHVAAERDEARAERDALRARLEVSEADRTLRLEVIQRQGDELGRVGGERNVLAAERDVLAAEVESQRGLLAHVAQSLDAVRALAGETLAGLLGPGKVKRLSAQLDALAGTLAARRGGDTGSRAA